MIVGNATAESTAEYAKRFEAEKGYLPTSYRQLGRTGLTCSEVGFGCYRIDTDIPEHGAALADALTTGCNLIDTSTNYADGGSEACVGHTLKDVVDAKKLTRDQVVIVSKVGYVQGSNMELAKTREAERAPIADMVKYMENCWHCIHPEFIADQLGRSLQRLGVERIDIYLLHNPEYYFADAVHHGSKQPLADLRTEFYERIRKAFAQLEEEVANGRIAAYGVSSNTFGASLDDPEATSLTEMWKIASEIAKRRSGNPSDHHFSVIQLPMNLFESDGVLTKNNGNQNEASVIEFARQNEIGVLLNRPLNAIINGSLVRLADFPDEGRTQETAREIADALSKLEEEFRQQLAVHITTAPGAPKPEEFFRWGTELARAELDSISLEQWRQIESQYIAPPINHLMPKLNEYFSSNLTDRWVDWRDRYLTKLTVLLKTIERDCSRRSQAVSNNISEKIQSFLLPEIAKESLSRKSLAILANVPGVTCVLNGMRTPKYVKDSMGIMKLPAFSVSEEIFEQFR
jgi:aryl-alcohol dehydrogenase-like predicted oxidoreductase